MIDERIHSFKTKWGWCGIAAGPNGLKRVIIPGKNNRAGVLRILRKDFPGAAEDPRGLSRAGKLLKEYFAGKAVSFNLPVDLDGLTPFQKKVLRATRKVPYGRRETYSSIARGLGRPRAARAVGGALARNPLPIVIPCHRIIAASGALGGFSAAGGTKVKAVLLHLETKIAKQRGLTPLLYNCV